MSADIQTLELVLKSPAQRSARRALGKLLHWRYRLFQQKWHDTHAVLEHLQGFPLLVLPGVLNPRLARSGEFFASQITPASVEPGSMVLDMGTGSGVCAIAAAKLARRVCAIDINPVAVRCARINSLLNSMEDRIEVLQGDLFAPVQGRRFDVVLFNPPFILGAPRSDADRAWRSIDVAERFATGLTQHLTPRGYALVVRSTFGDGAEYLTHFRRCGFSLTVLAMRACLNERLSLLRLRAAPG